MDAVAEGGVITFDCGPAPVTITLEATAQIYNDASDRVIIDGSGLVTLSGAGSGGAIYDDGNTVTLSIYGCVIEHNDVRVYGSAIFFVTTTTAETSASSFPRFATIRAAGTYSRVFLGTRSPGARSSTP